MNDIFSYNKITAEITAALKEKIGAHNVCADEEKLEAYSHDEVPQNAYDKKYTAELLLFPESTEHVSEIMKIAYEHKIPVTPRGAGTGLSGGALPAWGGIVMSFEKMNRILELDEENLTITTEPGVVTAEISRMAAQHGLLYAGDPCSGDASFIGGNIAENAGGNKVIKYGATGAQLLALEVVLPDGSVTWFGGKRRKDVTGLDFVHLMAGSEGILGIITKAVLKLMPLPRHSVDLLAAFPDTQSAIDFVPRIITEGGLIPASIEFLDHKALKLAEKYLNTEVPREMRARPSSSAGKQRRRPHRKGVRGDRQTIPETRGRRSLRRRYPQHERPHLAGPQIGAGGRIVLLQPLHERGSRRPHRDGAAAA